MYVSSLNYIALTGNIYFVILKKQNTLWNTCEICMYVFMYVCMYVCTIIKICTFEMCHI